MFLQSFNMKKKLLKQILKKSKECQKENKK